MKRFLLAIALALMSLVPALSNAQCCPDYAIYGACPSACPGGFCPSGGCPSGNCGSGALLSPMQTPQAEDTTAKVTPESVYPSVVKVYSIRTGMAEVGTGFIADRDLQAHVAIVVSCAHGYKSGDRVEVRTQDGQRYTAAILAMDKAQDVSVLRIQDPGLPVMYISPDLPKPGEKLTAVGFAAGKTFTTRVGALTGFRAVLSQDKCFLQTTCYTEQGCSGGPILDSKGYVCGTMYGYTRPASNHSGYDAVAPCLPIVMPRLKCQSMRAGITPVMQVFPADIAPPAGVTPCGVIVSTSPLELPWRRDIEGKLNEIEANTRSSPAIPAAPPAPIIISQPPAAPSYASGPDPSTIAALQNLGGQVQQHGQAIEQLGKGLAATNETVGKIADNQAKHGTLLERIEAKREGIGQSVDGDDKLRMVLIVAGIVLVLVLIVWNIMHGKGLIRQGIDKLAALNPGNQTLQNAAQRIDSTEDGWRAALTGQFPGLAAVNNTIDAKLQAALPAALAAALTGHPVLAAAAAVPAVVQGVQAAVQGLQAQVAQQAATVAQVALNTPAPGQNTGTSPVGIASPNNAPSAGTTINVATPAA